MWRPCLSCLSQVLWSSGPLQLESAPNLAEQWTDLYKFNLIGNLCLVWAAEGQVRVTEGLATANSVRVK